MLRPNCSVQCSRFRQIIFDGYRKTSTSRELWPTQSAVRGPTRNAKLTAVRLDMNRLEVSPLRPHLGLDARVMHDPVAGSLSSWSQTVTRLQGGHGRLRVGRVTSACAAELVVRPPGIFRLHATRSWRHAALDLRRRLTKRRRSHGPRRRRRMTWSSPERRQRRRCGDPWREQPRRTSTTVDRRHKARRAVSVARTAARADRVLSGKHRPSTSIGQPGSGRCRPGHGVQGHAVRHARLTPFPVRFAPRRMTTHQLDTNGWHARTSWKHSMSSMSGRSGRKTRDSDTTHTRASSSSSSSLPSCASL